MSTYTTLRDLIAECRIENQHREAKRNAQLDLVRRQLDGAGIPYRAGRYSLKIDRGRWSDILVISYDVDKGGYFWGLSILDRDNPPLLLHELLREIAPYLVATAGR